MSIPGAASPLFIGAAAEEAAFQIDRSLRFNSGDSAYLDRTPSSAGNRKTWTWSNWIKRTKLGVAQFLFNATDHTSTTTVAYFKADDTLEFYDYQSGAYTTQLVTSQVFRDISAWFHLVVVWDTTQGTASDRAKIYINGSQVTSFGTSTYPSQDTQSRWNNNVIHDIGQDNNNNFLDGYLAEVNFVDGTALAPTDFGEYDDSNNWNPKAYSGSYGTNGFHLDFSDNTSTTTIAEDSSGNNNDFTANNLSVASGSGNDSLIDTPTNYTADSGNNGGNYATMNPLLSPANTLSNGNLDVTAAGNNRVTLATFGIPASGKWYFEFTDVDSSSGAFITGVGTEDVDRSLYLGRYANGWGYQTHATNAGYYNNNNFTASGVNVHGSNTVVGIAIDRDSNKLWFSINGTFVNSGDPASGSNASFTNLPSSGFLFPGASSAIGLKFIFNAGQRPFSYTPPTGYKSLCSTNLPDPTIADGSTVFDVRSGLTSQFTISDLNFATDLVVAKSTSNSEYWICADVVRSFIGGLRWNDSDAEGSGAAITSVGATGYQSSSNWFTTGRTYATYNWDAGTTTATNNDGSIASSVRVNQSAGFSIVTWTGQSSGSATVGHGLNAAPEFILLKGRTGSVGWTVGHQSIGWTKRLQINTQATTSTSSNYWNDTAPTNSVFTSGANNVSNTFVAYCWSSVSGFSFFGSYVGNGSSDGTFVYTGHRSRFLLIKALIAGEDWIVIDTERETYNTVDSVLFANDLTAEITNSAYNTDILSNGFKLRGTNPRFNTSGETYVFASFAEHPFKTARAR